MTPLPILYSFRRCPYAMRARLAIIYAELSIELREVVLKEKPKSLLEYSPKGTVPVLILNPETKRPQQDSLQVIDESLDIMLWALNQNNANGLLRNSTADMALISLNDNEFKPLLDRYKYPDRFNEPSELDVRNEACGFIAHLESELTSKSYLGGNLPSLADIAIFPFIRQFAHVDMEWFKQSDFKYVNRWLSYWLDSMIFKSIMIKYDQWTGDNIVIFPST